MKLLPPFALFALACSGLATATVVNIDFATPNSSGYTGFGAAETTPGHTVWNTGAYSGSGNSITLLDLVDSAGSLTTVDFTLSGFQGSNAAGGGEMERASGYSELMTDYLQIDGGMDSSVPEFAVTATGKFSNLVVGASYDIYFYGQGSTFSPGAGAINRGQNSLFSVNGGAPLQTSWDGIAGGNGILTNGVEYVRFMNVVALNGGAEGGVINFTWANVVASGSYPNATQDLAPNGNATGNTASRYAALNAVQLVSVIPEPSGALLALLGMTGLLARRRR
ncbi:hypothetical protein OKA04_22480 [Luteolibacter flavescens]|uniref:PEP-CTERM sorting domain-containing protein n=1 Tax=Luteolibacter flavescens TaxID=1859460 RepID=A0ABT3FVE1_9BACT|nr:hypothetical protein [Luteolibacter flavescens]MCW1887520.1 hypothetical protein [Luteolibacter flavescens]